MNNNPNLMEDLDMNYKNKLEVNTSSEQAFLALNQGLHSWWGKISNSEFKAGGQFTIQFENEYWWTFKIIEYTPNLELVWKCIDGEPDFNKEWIGHVLHWEIEEQNGKCVINFHQVGLTPNIDCYDVCSNTWDRFITNGLKNFLETKK
ncbi:SRPBCC domain-containing protein [Flavivirga amylovorans]|uniref:SRPBCC domain-containing protein n=1 Tax=Flavivirga amylovorans TaxID=870486 RepID=A0ABT8X162_9FLAO|nr:SRPBCC domain-containing protein [Flavivirga amylovorans]MDO5987339.1 SRPBCC domain-containing protein [Flavivirga amylovorans]